MDTSCYLLGIMLAIMVYYYGRLLFYHMKDRHLLYGYLAILEYLVNLIDSSWKHLSKI
jgi:hypothetical protein